MKNEKLVLVILTILATLVFAKELPTRPDIRPLANENIVKITGVYGEVRESGEFARPHFHNGIDFACFENTPVKATAGGRVVESRYDPTFGNFIKIQHNFKHQSHDVTVFTIYAHLNEFFVLKGQDVVKNQQIGLSGNTGRSKGPHLHYELRNDTGNAIWNGTYQRFEGLESGKLAPANQQEIKYLEHYAKQKL
jgi:murein DD-endopeptidase MepM/ murein hydrolase activator NlpD